MTAARAHRTEAVPPGDTLAGPDYTDACAIGVDADLRTASQWARAAFEGAPRATRWFLLAGWWVLRLRLGPRPSPDHVLGWRILAVDPEQVVLGADSRVVGPTHLVLRVEPGRVVLATFLRYGRPGARAVWAVIAPIHRVVLRHLLGHARG